MALASLEGEFKGIELDLPTNTFLKCDFVYKDAEGSSWAYEPRARAVHRNQRMREDTLNSSRCHCQFDPRTFHAAFWIMACLWECLRAAREQIVQEKIRGGKNSVACNWWLFAKRNSVRFAAG